ncbi:pilin [Halobacillus massiliensis]|uniref:pilin n=1 Tax=Halobacillus massiliensis TaxID=1926286 RepID=UPI0009E4C66F|nr:pilin [Halobacillus massiliensis]
MPIIEGLERLLDDIAGWALMLIVPFLIVQAIIIGFKLSGTDDPHETRSIKSKAVKVLIGAAVIGTAPWIGSQLMSYF